MSFKYTDLSDCTQSELVDIMRSLGFPSVFVDADSDPDQLWWRDWENSFGAAAWDVEMFEIQVARSECAYGQSDLVEQSNFRSLLRDFPGVFTEMRWTNVSQLGIRADRLTGDVVNALAGLVDYALYDEDDHSELEQETFDAALSDYLIDDGMKWYMDDDDAETLRTFNRMAVEQAFVSTMSQLDIYPEFEYEDVIFQKDDMRLLMAATLESLIEGME